MHFSRDRFLLLLVTLAWIGIIVYVGLQPRLPEVPILPIRAQLPLGHYVVHLILSGLVFLLVSPGRSRSGQSLATVIAIAFPGVLGLIVEGLQSFQSERGAQVFDVAWNIAGALTGVTGLLVLIRLGVARRLLIAAIVVSSAMLIAAVSASVFIWDPSLPRVGDHWHARYEISICAHAMASLPGTQGGVHTHGSGTIHIHPLASSQAGANANLALFLKTSGGELTDSKLTLPSGLTYTDGDQCQDGQRGKLTVAVNGGIVKKPSLYVPRDEDQILLKFSVSEE